VKEAPDLIAPGDAVHLPGVVRLVEIELPYERVVRELLDEQIYHTPTAVGRLELSWGSITQASRSVCFSTAEFESDQDLLTVRELVRMELGEVHPEALHGCFDCLGQRRVRRLVNLVPLYRTARADDQVEPNGASAPASRASHV